MSVEDLRMIAEEWQEIEDDREAAIDTVRSNLAPHPRFPRLMLAAQQAEVSSEFDGEVAKYIELASEIGVDPDPDSLKWWGESYEPTLIPEDDFEDYARELAEDIGDMPREQSWPASYIDWEAAADALKMDYTTVEYDGTTHYIRSC